MRRSTPEAKIPEFAGSASFIRRPCSILILCVLLGFGMFLAVPAEDVPETAYDESEELPYEGSPLFSIVLPLVATRTTQAVPSSLPLKLDAPSPFTAAVCDADAHRPADARVSLALLCTLLC
jgi:hypothetical protein